eukprot:363457-Chlamydomonas_euryale.AAC.5
MTAGILIAELKTEALVDPWARTLSAFGNAVLMLVLIIGLMLDNDNVEGYASALSVSVGRGRWCVYMGGMLWLAEGGFGCEAHASAHLQADAVHRRQLWSTRMSTA